MDIVEKLDAAYYEVTSSLKNYTGATNTILGMRTYLELFSAVELKFADRMNEDGRALLVRFPDRDSEVRNHIKKLHYKLISTYKRQLK